LPWSGAMFLTGFIAVTGSPPFGPFVSEFTIVSAAFTQHRYLIAAAMLLFVLVVFMGMGSTVLSVVQGRPNETSKRPNVQTSRDNSVKSKEDFDVLTFGRLDVSGREPLLMTISPLILLVLSLVMG